MTVVGNFQTRQTVFNNAEPHSEAVVDKFDVTST